VPSHPPRLPKYRHYGPKNLAVVRIDGRDVYLGPYDSAQSHEKYRRVVAEWLTARAPRPGSDGRSVRTAPLAVCEVMLAYLDHAVRHYRTPDGRPTRELDNIRDALRPVKELYGLTPAAEFGPLVLRSVRQAMIDARLKSTTVNARVHRVRRMFRWAASVELIPASVVRALDTVDGLKRGRSAAEDPDPVRPVPVEHVEAVLPFLSRPVAAMVKVQLLTGCRPGEVIGMRGCDLSPGKPNWEFRPQSHKNSWRGQDRVIPLGPRAQEVVREFLTTDPSAHLFSARQAVAEHHARRSGSRRTKRTPSELARRCPDGPGRHHADRFDRRGYRQAVVRACRRAGVPRWSPLQLRHTAATLIRARYGLEAAQSVLGHAKPDATLLYAERDLARAHAVAAAIG
jgi:integrase